MITPRRLRIVHVSWGLDVGGLEKLLVEFARWIERERFDLHFVSLGSRGPLANTIAGLGWPVTALDSAEGVRPGLVLRLAGCFRKYRADVVHTHDDRPLLYGALAARLARTPVLIHTQHHGTLKYITPRKAALAGLAARLTHRYVCVSKDSARLAVAQGIPAGRLCTIWNGIDLTRFAWSGTNPTGPVVTVARLVAGKDLATLIQAVRLAVQEEPGFRVEIAGEGPDRPTLEQMIAEFRLEQSVRLLGEVRDIPAFLARGRFFVLPSLSEGISLTILEAMARGLAVVTTPVGGNPEVVVDGETGLLVPVGDAAALSRALLHLRRNPEECQRLGRAGRRRVEEHFDVRRMVGRYEELYSDSGHRMLRSRGIRRARNDKREFACVSPPQ
jgi:glycosyltransferase involved in cell wall biosynthesis